MSPYISLSQSQITYSAALIKAMNSPVRLRILDMLVGGEHNVGELTKMVGMSQSGVSQHLAILLKADLVQTRRDKQTIYYSLNDDRAETLLVTLRGICQKHAFHSI